MAIARVNGDTGTGNQSSSATLVLTLGSTYNVGTLVVVMVGCDNAGAAGISSISTSMTDTKSNTYTRQVVQNRTTGGTAGDGCTVALFDSVLTTQLTAVDTITANFSPNTTAKVIQAASFSGTASAPYANNGNSGAGTTWTGPVTATYASGDLLILATANESNTGPVLPTDITNGTWSSNTGPLSNGAGGDATKMSGFIESKLLTGSGTQTPSAATGATTDWATVYLLYSVPVVATKTPFVSPYPQILPQ